mmetsp:Transcript_20295/g.37709  ORF Transcript_20295/g.37709 Transcript_20295/m.37709 type:complete len:399 (-) Transcript_20295:495-1691(-)|eukprot:CAMPEP_0206381582 /NCGR_PEP_ID=MMETSP0294-20121207/12743_1 /ASSEMBLY_ACC=CAM_ASM_000327 /TAXON_ID=39354 /ORGANISM="Heterosigma akashiwo, Strain CCMP2393" /LENGTH=398 /DNA_ID=CAMNT_0053831085 /DNA_START=58 /DNA_END=1254 /DNA_ORIENTATION=-
MADQIQVNKTAKFSVLDVKGISQPKVAVQQQRARVAEETKQEEGNWKVSELSSDEKYELARSVGEECIQESELRTIFDVKQHPIVYDGFEPSGRMHIAQGVMRAINVNKLTKAGCVFKFWVADWFAQLNNKMGGDLKKIQTVGQYMIEIWKAVGMDMTNVQFLWASEEINRRPDEYWGRVMEIARLNNLARIQRCCTIMGRKESDEMSSAQIFYPCMQCADVFFLKADICQLGLDQRKVNMLAREYCDMTRPKIKHKPIILSHHMLLGLKQGQEKMSKSDPDSAIFMEDSEADLNRKIKKAWCPEGELQGNPILDYVRHIVFGYAGQITIEFKSGEVETYTDIDRLEADYVAGKIYPNEIKPALTKALNQILQPVRDHFSSGEPKKLLAKVKSYKVTK